MSQRVDDPAVGAPSLPPTITPELVARLVDGIAATPGGDVAVTYAPYTGQELAALPQSDPGDVAAAFERARAAQVRWAAADPAERARIVLRFHDLVLDRQDEGLDLIQAENGKARRDAFLEIADVAMTARYYARTAGRLLAPKRRRGALPLLTHTTELRHPRGVVAVISPWNYPLSMAASDTIPALLAGNAVVQKPDNQSALTALWARSLMLEAGLEEDVWLFVAGPPETIGDPLIEGADFVMFTGSTVAGRRIARAAGERLVGASLELGGKNAMLVLPDADLGLAVEGAVAGAFASTGQLCVSIERMYLAREIFDDFAAAFAQRTKGVALGAAYDYGMEVGSLTGPTQLARVTEHVEDAVAKGATVLAGGRARPDLGPLFYEPTILTGVAPGMAAYAAETFGPVVALYPVASLDEAVAAANDSAYGLNASVWTRDAAKGRAVAARLRAGTVNINEAFAATWASIDAPMGGMGDSGIGRRHGAEGLLKYTESQTVAHQRLRPMTPPDAVPWTAWARMISANLRTQKRSHLR